MATRPQHRPEFDREFLEGMGASEEERRFVSGGCVLREPEVFPVYVCEVDLSEDTTKEPDPCGGWMHWDGEFFLCGSCGNIGALEHVKLWGLKEATPKLREGDQPLPVVNDSPDIQSLVIADIEERRKVGVERYGTALQPFNGRSALRDLYEELLDAAMYAKQRLVEEEKYVCGCGNSGCIEHGVQS